jgi:RNA polymerase sigma-70 factor (ECF subfamily)
MRFATTIKDQELVALFRQGNNQAFECLIQRHRDKVFYFILYLIRDWHIAEDLLQEAIIKIYKSIQKGHYKEEGKFLPWALSIARNYCFDHKRMARHLPVRYQHVFYEDLLYEECPDRQIVNKQNNFFIRSLIDSLPDEQKKVIIYRHYEEMSFREIALITNCSINTALGRMRYALINLRKIVLDNASPFQNLL